MRNGARLVFLALLLGVVLVSVLSVRRLGFSVEPPYDKIAHLGMYFVLAFFAALGWPQWRGVALIGLPLVGLALEAAQTLTPAREFSWADVFANAAGIGLAVAVSAAITRWLDRG